VTETIRPSEASAVVTTPESKVLPKRNGHRGMLPATWTGRSVRVEYVGAGGEPVATGGTLLDWCPVGPILNIAGAKTCLAWDALRVIELQED
jgi:hypothetical protein